MLVLLSPAKSLDYNSPLLTKKSTKPRLMPKAAKLVEELKEKSPAEIGKLMSISDKLATLNAQRYQDWQPDATPQNARQAVLAFTGDVYQGLSLSQWTSEDFAVAQKQLRILSGLYGLLRPLDLMQAYRLEMGTRLQNKEGKDLYAYWGNQITDLLNADLKTASSEDIINLASNEYFKAVKKDRLKAQITTPVFKDEKNGQYKIISFYAKRARGLMADYIVRHRLSSPEPLKKFNTNGYQFSKNDSTPATLLFTRKESLA